MRQPTSDLRIRTARPLMSPAILEEDLPLSEAGATLVRRGRRDVGEILAGRDDRLVALVGPCSIHDPQAALDYAKRLKPIADRLAGDNSGRAVRMRRSEVGGRMERPSECVAPAKARFSSPRPRYDGHFGRCCSSANTDSSRCSRAS